MTRLVELELTNIRNINHGVLRFHTLESGGSLTGIYGQNGAGKTTVIDALTTLKHLMAGQPLTGADMDIIALDRRPATIRAVIRLDERYVGYTAEFDNVDDKPTLLGETLHFGPTPDRLGRPFVTWQRHDGDDPNLKPASLWDAVTTDRTRWSKLSRAHWRACEQSMSFLFSPEVMHDLPAALRSSKRPLPVRAQRTLDMAGMDPFDALARLRSYAVDDMMILTTRRNTLLTGSDIALAADRPDGGIDDRLFDQNVDAESVSRDDAKRLGEMVDSFNVILPELVHGLTLSLVDHGGVLLADGTEGRRVSLATVRDGRRVPFRSESEGVRRIVSMLTYLIHAFNDPDACVAIDELDAGVFEYLLGDIIRAFEHASGQLIFTAHNLRVLEKTWRPDRTIILATTDPDHRFTPFTRIGRTQNGRRQYIAAIGDVGGDHLLYQPPLTSSIINALIMAAHPELRRQAEADMQARKDERLDPMLERLFA